MDRYFVDHAVEEIARRVLDTAATDSEVESRRPVVRSGGAACSRQLAVEVNADTCAIRDRHHMMPLVQRKRIRHAGHRATTGGPAFQCRGADEAKLHAVIL